MIEIKETLLGLVLRYRGDRSYHCFSSSKIGKINIDSEEHDLSMSGSSFRITKIPESIKIKFGNSNYEKIDPDLITVITLIE